MLRQRVTARRPPGRALREPSARLPRLPLVVLATLLLAPAPPALAAHADLPPWDPRPSGGPPTAPTSPSIPPSAASSVPSQGPPAPAPATPPTTGTSPPATQPTAAPAESPDATPTDVAPVPPPPTSQSSAPAGRSPRPEPTEIPPPPIDPNDAPFMRAPNNQIQSAPPRTRPDVRRGWSARRRFALTVAPAFASTRFEFQGRTAKRHHGAGLNLELDAQIWRWIWLRAHGTYSGHPVDEVRIQQPDMSVVQTAPPGSIHVAGFGGGPVFALDLGRFLPLIEVGLAGMRVATPAGGGIAGLRGEACRSDGTCDVGLRCNAARTCQPNITPELYFGGAIDLLVRRHFSFGAQFRYYARLSAPATFPVYLLGTIRMTVRF